MRLAQFLTAACAAIASACSTYPPPQAPPQTEVVADISDKTVALVTDDSDKLRAYCSGVWINGRDFITAQHCVDDVAPLGLVEYAIRLDVYDLNGPKELPRQTSRTGQLILSDAAHDLAVVRAAFPPPHGVAELGSDPVQGDAVQAMGHSRGLWWSYSSGHVAAIRQAELDIDILWVQATTPISGGNSGGGLFDVSGRLVGIASRQYTRGQNLNFFVHAQHVAALLARI